MKLQDMRSIGSTLLLALTIVSSVSLSARLYKDNLETQKAEAAMLKSSAVACTTSLEAEPSI